MNNKTLRIVVALVATVLLVCSCVFAAEIGEVTYDAKTGALTVPFTAGEGATKAALLVKNAAGDIVALNQQDKITGTFNEVIDTTKLAVDDVLTVSVGDNAATSEKADSEKVNVVAPVVEYTITFVDEDGTTVLQTGKVAEGTMPVAPADPVKEANEKYTYTFAGWTPEIVAATADATYTATYTETAREYTVVFYDEDGVTVLSEQKLIYGATPVEPEAPAKEGFTFKGWDKDVVAVTGDATYTAVFEENAPEIEYASVLQNVTYNSIEGTVVRITGLDTTSVVTVDGVTAKYYTKTDGTLVHVACVPRTAEPVISVADGTPVLIKFGDVDGNGSVNGSDKIELGRRVTNFERQKPSYKKYSLPTDLMELLVHDVDGNGAVNGSDKIEVGRAVTNFERQKPSYKKYSLETMGCYTK